MPSLEILTGMEAVQKAGLEHMLPGDMSHRRFTEATPPGVDKD